MSLQCSSKKYIKCYFPERLKQMRNLYKYTQKQVAEFIGVSASAYSSWERDVYKRQSSCWAGALCRLVCPSSPTILPSDPKDF